MSNRKEEILKESYETVFSTQKYDDKCPSKGVCDLFALPAMDIYSKEVAIEYIMWVIQTFTTDEGRLPLSGNVSLGGLTIFIDHVEYPFSHTYELFLQSKKQ